MVLNWANAWHKNKESFSSNTSLELEYDDTYEYSFWIPVFRISKIGKDGDFKIITAGKLSGPKDKRFWDLMEYLLR